MNAPDIPLKGEIRHAFMVQRRHDDQMSYPLGFYWTEHQARESIGKEHGGWGELHPVDVVWDGRAWRQLWRSLNIK